MAKPATFHGYTDQYTVDCERVLVTLLRGLGPWKESVFLVGGLTPRYLVVARPPAVPAHAGTLDVDIVIDLQILADTAGYSTLEDNLRRMRFERSTNDKGQKLSWRWQTRTEHGALMVVELLADAPEIAGGRVEPLPTEGTISALNIPHSSIVFDCTKSRRFKQSFLTRTSSADTREIDGFKLASYCNFGRLDLQQFSCSGVGWAIIRNPWFGRQGHLVEGKGGEVGQQGLETVDGKPFGSGLGLGFGAVRDPGRLDRRGSFGPQAAAGAIRFGPGRRYIQVFERRCL